MITKNHQNINHFQDAKINQSSPPNSTRVTFDWKDPMFLDQQLSDDERLIRDAAFDYCQDKLMPRVKQANREEYVAGPLRSGWRR